MPTFLQIPRFRKVYLKYTFPIQVQEKYIYHNLLNILDLYFFCWSLKLSILQMYFVSGKYRKSILEVYLKYTEIVQGIVRRNKMPVTVDCINPSTPKI